MMVARKDGYFAVSGSEITRDKAKATRFSMAEAKRVKYLLNRPRANGASGGWRLLREK